MPSAAERRALEAACDAICGDTAAADVVLELSRLSRQERELRLLLALLAVRGFAAFPRAKRERLAVNVDHNRPSRREELMARGLRELGWHVAEMPRNVRGRAVPADCVTCGFERPPLSGRRHSPACRAGWRRP